MNPFNDLRYRLRRSIGSVAAQYWCTLLLIAIGVAWTRLPDQYWWQVIFSLLIPALLIVALIVLEAVTMRSLVVDDERRVKLAWGVLTVAAWAAIYAAIWIFLNWSSDQVPALASYLNSHAPSRARATFLTYNHIQNWLTLIIWILRWVIVPGKIIPFAIASAQSGWQLPWEKLVRLLLNWRWWPAVVLAALAAVEWPSHFYNAVPQGSVSHQVWTVLLKLAANYMLAITSWVLLLAWAAVLISPRPGPTDEALKSAPVGSAPLDEDSVRLPLPDSGDNRAGNA